MTLNPSLDCRIRLLKVALDYSTLSLEIRSGLQNPKIKAVLTALSDFSANPHEMTEKELVFVSKIVRPSVLFGVLDATEPEAIWPTYEFWLERLLRSEIEDGPIPNVIAEFHNDDSGGANFNLEKWARDLEPHVFADIIDLLSDEENHQIEYDRHMVILSQVLFGKPELLEALASLFKSRADQKDHTHWAAPIFLKCRPKPEDDNPNNEENPGMPADPAIADAISRLQDTFSNTMTSASGGSSSNFDVMLEELQYSTLSIPSLDSEAALNMGEAKLADKIFKNLSQAVKVEPGVETDLFKFHPRYVRTIDYAEGGARGGAAIIAQEVETIRPTFIDRLHDLKPEECTCDDNEPLEIIHEAEEVLIAISNEVGSDTGIFVSKMKMLVERLMDLVTELQVLYGIKLEELDARLRVSRTTRQLWGDAIPRAKAQFAPRPGGRTKIEVGVLVEDANDEALKSIIYMIDRLVELFVDRDGVQLGATFSRLMNQLDAIPPSVSDVRNALRRAGVSLVDQKASFSSDGGDTVYELDRLLSWIDEETGKWHADLMDGQAKRRDIRWMIKSLENMQVGLDAFDRDGANATPYKAVTPRNEFAAARRQIKELAGLLNCACRDAVSILNAPRR